MFRLRFRQWFATFAFLFPAAAMSWSTFAGDCVPPPNEVCETATVFSNADLPYEITAPLGCVKDIIDRPYCDVFFRFDCSQTGTYHIHGNSVASSIWMTFESVWRRNSESSAGPRSDVRVSPCRR